MQSLAWVEISKKSWVWFWRRRQGHGKRWGDSGAELYSELIFWTTQCATLKGSCPAGSPLCSTSAAKLDKLRTQRPWDSYIIQGVHFFFSQWLEQSSTFWRVWRITPIIIKNQIASLDYQVLSWQAARASQYGQTKFLSCQKGMPRSRVLSCGMTRDLLQLPQTLGLR